MIMSDFNSGWYWVPGSHEDGNDNVPVKRRVTDGADHVVEQGIMGGGKNEDSEVNNMTIVHTQVNKTLFNPDATTETVITAAPCYFYGFQKRTGTGTLTIRDDNSVNGAVSDFLTYTLGTDDFKSPFGIYCPTGLTAQAGTGTDDCTIFWRAA